jgi:hypothetical protein
LAIGDRGRAGTRSFAPAQGAPASTRSSKAGTGSRGPGVVAPRGVAGCAVGVDDPASARSGPASARGRGSAAETASDATLLKEEYRKPDERVLSGAVGPVKWGLLRTTAAKIKDGCAQLRARFHAQTRTCPASLPSWPCRFDPGHPLHRIFPDTAGFPLRARLPSSSTDCNRSRQPIPNHRIAVDGENPHSRGHTLRLDHEVQIALLPRLATDQRVNTPPVDPAQHASGVKHLE